ncbi:MAG: hypothetical protein ACE149_14750 [Armatimonadota bacterium]
MAEIEQRHPGGRPRLTFDLRQVEELGKIQSTQPELAAVLGCGLSTVKDRIANDEEFSTAYKRGMEAGKSSLRRLQWKSALAGNVVMQIWLGKQYLGQRDQQAVEVTRTADTEDWERLFTTSEGRELNGRLLEVFSDALQLLNRKGSEITDAELVQPRALPAPAPSAEEGGT